MGWAWKTGTPRERADMVRSHQRLFAGVDGLCGLFALTSTGAFAIIGGDDWRPEYSTKEESVGSMKDLLGDAPAQYPHAPGFKEQTTSKDAARAVAGTAGTLREQVFECLRVAGPAGLTPDEIAEKLGRTVLSIRPRVTELAHDDPPWIVPTGGRRANASGLKAKVWRVYEPAR